MGTLGMTIVGYRYGEAPESGKSYNYRDNCFEPGVSMAQVGFDKEVNSFAISDAAANRKRYYYVGTICGTGGDDEICLSNVKRISRKDYLAMRKEMINVHNAIVNERINRRISLIENGWHIGTTIERLEEQRKKYIKKAR